MSIGLSITLFLIGCAAISVSRRDYVVTGTLRAVVETTYPWNGGGRFDLVMQLADGGWLRFAALHGNCVNAARLAGRCDKPGFPLDQPIRLRVRGFSNPNACPDLGRFLSDWSCLGRYFRRYARVEEVEIAGSPVTTGWSPNLSVWALYAAVAAAAILLAHHQWRLARIRTRTLIIAALILFGCLFWPLEGFF